MNLNSLTFINVAHTSSEVLMPRRGGGGGGGHKIYTSVMEEAVKIFVTREGGLYLKKYLSVTSPT